MRGEKANICMKIAGGEGNVCVCVQQTQLDGLVKEQQNKRRGRKYYRKRVNNVLSNEIV